MLENISAMIRTDAAVQGKIQPGFISSGCGSIDGKSAASSPSPLRSQIKATSGDDPGTKQEKPFRPEA